MKYAIKVTRAEKSRLSTVDFDNIPFGRVFSDHMFVTEYANGEWINPRIEPFTSFDINPASMGLHYGQNIFEGMKASKSKDGEPFLFRPEMHARRLNLSAARMCMPSLPEELFLEALHLLMIRDAISRRLRCYDFMKGSEDSWKSRFGIQPEPMFDWILPGKSVRGAMVRYGLYRSSQWQKTGAAV